MQDFEIIWHSWVHINFVNIYSYQSVNIAYSLAGLKKHKDNVVKCLKKKKKKLRLKIRLWQQRSRDRTALCLTDKAPYDLASPNSMPTFQDPRTSSHLCLCHHPYWGSLTSSPHPSKFYSSFSSNWSLILPRTSFLDTPGPSHLPLT